MQPKTDRKKLIDKLDTIVRRMAQARDMGRCQYNGCLNRGEEVHHIFSRRHMSVRFDLDNLILLCPECHQYAHGHKENFNAVMWLQLGVIYDGLSQLSKVTVNYKSSDLLEILEGLKRNGG